MKVKVQLLKTPESFPYFFQTFRTDLVLAIFFHCVSNDFVADAECIILLHNCVFRLWHEIWISWFSYQKCTCLVCGHFCMGACIIYHFYFAEVRNIACITVCNILFIIVIHNGNSKALFCLFFLVAFALCFIYFSLFISWYDVV